MEPNDDQKLDNQYLKPLDEKTDNMSPIIKCEYCNKSQLSWTTNMDHNMFCVHCNMYFVVKRYTNDEVAAFF